MYIYPSRTWPSSLTGGAIARKARGPGFDSWLGCGGHFFLSSRHSISYIYFNIYIYIYTKQGTFSPQKVLNTTRAEAKQNKINGGHG